MISATILDRQEADERRTASPVRDPMYVFGCHVEWRNRGNPRAYSEVLAALGDCDGQVRVVAEMLLTQS